MTPSFERYARAMTAQFDGLLGDMRHNLGPLPPATCPKCGAVRGGDWRQCEGVCPLDISPHYKKPEVINAC